MKHLSVLLTLLLLSASSVTAMALDRKEILARTSLSDRDFIAAMNATYPEMRRLTEPVRGSPDAKMVLRDDSLSKILFGKQHGEYDRMATGLLALKWVLTRKYQQFIHGQPTATALPRQSFDGLCEATDRLAGRGLLGALVASLAFNDLGKVITFADEIAQRTGVTQVDHDDVLLTALQHFPDQVPSFGALKESDRTIILNGMKARVNLGYLVQAEGLAASLNGLRGLSSDTVNFNNLHLLYDLSGARGHVSNQGALRLDGPTYRWFTLAFDALKTIADAPATDILSPVRAYNHYLRRRMKALGGQGDASFSRETYALARLTCMSRCENSEQAADVQAAFAQLPPDTRNLLIENLYKTGVTDRGVLIGYAPAIIDNSKAAHRTNTREALKLAFIYLARVFALAEPSIAAGTEERGVFTVDCVDLAERFKTPDQLGHYALGLEKVGSDARLTLARTGEQQDPFLC